MLTVHPVTVEHQHRRPSGIILFAGFSLDIKRPIVGQLVILNQSYYYLCSATLSLRSDSDIFALCRTRPFERCGHSSHNKKRFLWIGAAIKSKRNRNSKSRIKRLDCRIRQQAIQYTQTKIENMRQVSGYNLALTGCGNSNYVYEHSVDDDPVCFVAGRLSMVIKNSFIWDGWDGSGQEKWQRCTAVLKSLKKT